MILLAFALYDDAVKAFTPPTFARHRGEAVRSFVQACNDEKSHLRLHHKDYTLFNVGSFDDGTGLFIPLMVPERVISATECVDDDIFPPERRLPG